MGLLKILSTVKDIVDFATDDKTKEAATGLQNMANNLGIFDTNNDGKFTMEDYHQLVKISESYASIIGHVGMLDHDEIQEAELNAGLEAINQICFSEQGFLNDAVIEFSQLPKKEVRNQIFNKMENPISLKKIAQEAEAIEKEEEFYEIACTIVLADAEITVNEREFLDHFASLLKLSKFDIKNIERQFKS